MPAPPKPNATRDRLYETRDALPLFSSATFDCYLNRGSLRFDANGELSVSFLVPATAVDDALSLRYLAANPLPLTITVEVMREYQEDVQEIEDRLAS
jgi:hypothetical protein